jgi:hypothetical protein
MGVFSSMFGQPYAAIGGSACSVFGDKRGNLHFRDELVPVLRTVLEDANAALDDRAEALVLLHALATCLAEMDRFVFVGTLTCPYTEVPLESTVLEAVVRKHAGRVVVQLGPEVMTVCCPGDSMPLHVGADAFWVTYSEHGADAAGSMLQRTLASHGHDDPHVFLSGAAPIGDPIPGVVMLTMPERAQLFDAVARENIAATDTVAASCCAVTYAHDAGFARWMAGEQCVSRSHGTITAAALLSRLSASDAAKEFAAL